LDDAARAAEYEPAGLSSERSAWAAKAAPDPL
jgi:hypothetical protein